MRENLTTTSVTDEQRRDSLANEVWEADQAWFADIGNATLRSDYVAAKRLFRDFENDAIARGATEKCSRCGGAGGWKGWPGFTCFRCGGAGCEPLRKTRFQAAPNVRATRNAKLDAEIAEKDARFRGAINGLGEIGEALLDAQEEVKAFNANTDFAEPSRETFFRDELAHKLWRWGSLSEKQIDAVQRGLDREREREAEKAAAGPLTEGEQEIIGEIVSTKLQESRFGTQRKMLVKLDNGNKVWGTVPKALAGHADRGTRIVFTATVKRSDDDPHFGFFKQPKGARLDNQQRIEEVA